MDGSDMIGRRVAYYYYYYYYYHYYCSYYYYCFPGLVKQG